MKVLRSDSPEISRCFDSKGAVACWGWSALALVCIASVLGLFISFTLSLTVSVRTGVWLGLPLTLVLNLFLLWRGMSPRLNWVVAGCADRVYIRLFIRRGMRRHEVDEPDAIMLEASEIASISIRTVEVFLYGPKPKIVESLIIEPAQTVAGEVSGYTRPLLARSNPTSPCSRPIDAEKRVLVGDGEGSSLTIDWKWCHPASRVFLQKLARECPSVMIAREKRSELDLNGIWRGISLNLDSQKRQLLLQAKRLGFGSNCRWLLCRYKYISFRKAATYIAEIEREEASADHSAISR